MSTPRTPGRLSPVTSSSARAVDQAYEALQTALANGAIEPGTRLYEVQLAEELGVSRTPVREALQRLEAVGLAHRLPGRGLVVAEVTEQDVQELGEIRTALDVLAAGLVARRASGSDWDVVHERLLDLEEAVASRRDRVSRVREAHRAFHQEIYHLAFRELAATLLEQNLLRHLEISTRVYTVDADVRATTARDHERLLSALSSGNVDEAEHAARAHAASGARRAAHAWRARNAGSRTNL